MKKNILLWIFTIISIVLVYNYFGNNSDLLFKLKDTSQETNKKSQNHTTLDVCVHVHTT